MFLIFWFCIPLGENSLSHKIGQKGYSLHTKPPGSSSSNNIFLNKLMINRHNDSKISLCSCVKCGPIGKAKGFTEATTSSRKSPPCVLDTRTACDDVKTNSGNNGSG